MHSLRALAVLLIGFSLAAVSADAGVKIAMDASSFSIPADGVSTSRILVTVLDESGASVPDGFEIRLTTSAGDITPVVYTTGGRAAGVLTSAAMPQTAIVTASAGGETASVQVEFSSSLDYEELSAAAKTVRMTGKSLAYSVDRDFVIGSGGVTVEYKGLTIHAAGIQVAQGLGQIRAQGGVTVKKGDKTLSADALSCAFRDDRIRLMISNGVRSVQTYDLAKLERVTDDRSHVDTASFTPLMDAQGRNWIVSERLVLIPRQKILFFKASIYVGDAKVIKMPYYVYSYQKRESILQQVRYDTTDGMLIDLPFYYRLTNSGAGALKLRYAANGAESGGYTRPRKGSSLGLEQDYAVGAANYGRVFVDSIASSSQAFELSHHLEFGSVLTGGRADLSARYQPSSSYAKNLYNANVNVTGGLASYTYSFYGYFGGSVIPGRDLLDPGKVDYLSQSSCSLRAILRPRRPSLTGAFGSVTPSLTLGYGPLGGSSASVFYQSLGVNFSRINTSPRPTGANLDGTMSVTATGQGALGGALRVRPSLRTSWLGGSASLDYTLNVQAGTAGTIANLGTHQVGLNLFLYGGSVWNSTAYANYGLDTNRLNLFSMLNYRMAKRTQMRFRYDLYSYGGSSYSYRSSYFKAGVYRSVGPYEVGIAWSPDGHEYGVDTGKRLWLEIGGSGF
jgi:hypothetical protein